MAKHFAKTDIDRIRDLERQLRRTTAEADSGTGGGGAELSDATPEDLGTADPGIDTEASRSDHVHDMPKLDDVDAPDDNTDLNASTSAHGLLRKLDNDASHFLDGTGSWSPITGGLGSSLYGDGFDGDLTLGSNTTVSGEPYFNCYNNVTLNGFTLTFDEFRCIHIKGTLSLGGGTIQSCKSAPKAGGVSSQTGGGGVGGTGGGTVGPLWVFAKTIIGTGTIEGAGVGGGNGTQGGTVVENKGANGGIGGNNTTYVHGVSLALGAAGAPGATGTLAAIYKRIFYSPLNWIFISDRFDSSTASEWYHVTQSGAGGQSGESQAANGPAGGTPAGGSSYFGAGGAGGTSEGRAGVVGGGAGGGGGGGSAGCVCVVVTDSAPSTLTVSAKGGDGGTGGAKGAGVSSGNAGGGGGGGGGIAILIAQAGCTATVTAVGGAGGASGGGSATTGTGGGNGRSMLLAR